MQSGYRSVSEMTVEGAQALGYARSDTVSASKTLKYFNTFDEINEHWIAGVISHEKPTYGCMVIFTVDDRPTKQIVYATPKLKYPWDKLGTFRFPQAKFIRVYEKYDGTNILAYKYETADGEPVVGFKTRLCPTLAESQFGNWPVLLRQVMTPILERAIIDHVVNKGYNLSFELYGAQNPHLIRYDIPLELRFLFGVTQDDGRVVDPNELPDMIRPATLLAEIDNPHDLESFYKKFQAEQEALNSWTDDGLIEGGEGCVWYLHTVGGHVHQFKCKPPGVEEVHFASEGISKAMVKAAVIKAFEHTDAVTYQTVRDILCEDFEEGMVDRSHESIMERIDEVKAFIDFRDRILNLYNELNLNLWQNKGHTMRTLSKHFKRQDMRKVYSVLDAFIGVIK